MPQQQQSNPVAPQRTGKRQKPLRGKRSKKKIWDPNDKRYETRKEMVKEGEIKHGKAVRVKKGPSHAKVERSVRKSMGY